MRVLALTITCALLLLFATKSKAQVTPEIAYATELTGVGTYWSLYGGLGLGKRHTFGVLFEDRFNKYDSKFNESAFMTGLYYRFLIFQDTKMNASIMLRGGYVNDKFLILVPSLMAGYNFNERFSFNFWGTYRSELAAVALGLQYRFAKRDGNKRRR